MFTRNNIERHYITDRFSISFSYFSSTAVFLYFFSTIRKNDFCEMCRLGKRKVRFCLRSLLCYSVLNTRLVKHAMRPIPGFRFGPDFHISLQSPLQPLDTRSGERLATRTLVRNSYSKHTVGGIYICW